MGAGLAGPGLVSGPVGYGAAVLVTSAVGSLRGSFKGSFKGSIGFYKGLGFRGFRVWGLRGPLRVPLRDLWFRFRGLGLRGLRVVGVYGLRGLGGLRGLRVYGFRGLGVEGFRGSEYLQSPKRGRFAWKLRRTHGVLSFRLSAII